LRHGTSPAYVEVGSGAAQGHAAERFRDALHRSRKAISGGAVARNLLAVEAIVLLPNLSKRC
jgi:hypothetical protein